MTDTTLPPKPEFGPAEDLRNCLPEETLVHLTFDAVHAALASQHPNGRQPPLPPGKPRVCLTLLTYSYASGVYGSQEIADRVSADPHLLYLSAKIGISANDLRQFRRHQRALLQQALRTLLELAWTEHPQARQDASGDGFKARCEQVAERRINEAILRDMMALDA